MHKGYVAMGLFFLLPGLLFVFGSWGAYSADTNILAHGATASATILKKDYVFSGEGDSDFDIRYQFTPEGGAPITRSYGIDKEAWRALKVGDSITVHYASTPPYRSFPDGYGNTSRAMAMFASLLGTLLVLMGGGIVYGGLRTPRKT